jgi:uncharacterized protein
MEHRFSVVTLGVGDLKRARQFYEDGLGWTRGNNSDDVVFYQLNGTILALFPRTELAKDARLSPEGHGFGGIALALCARSKEEVDVILAQPKRAGAKMLKPAEDVFWGGYSGYFADPDGHPWEIAWNPFWIVTSDGNVRFGKDPA